MNKNSLIIVLLGYLSVCASCTYQIKTASSTLAQAWSEFSNPEDSTRTKVWWFHGETETTREGITADLEAYKRAGVGGVVYYDQVHGKGENALLAFSPEWWEMLRFAAAEAKRIGLSFEVNLSNGYVAGGPWITKALSMQRLTATDTLVSGGQHFDAILPLPNRSEFWDIAVLAFPVTAADWETSVTRKPDVSCNIPQLPARQFLQSNVPLVNIPPQKPNQPVYITLDFKEEFTARSISYKVRQRGKATTGAMNEPGAPADTFHSPSFIKQPDLGELEVSNDGIHYRKVCDIKPIYQAAASRWNQKTISFPAEKGRYFRLNLHDWCWPGDSRPDMPFGNVVLSSRARMDQWEEKASLYSEYILADETPEYFGVETIDPDQIVDLTAKMDKDGRLQWDVPEGDWMIMRFAHESTGGPAKHGRKNLAGLECDKLSREAVIVQWNNYFKRILDTLTVAGTPPLGMIMDSHEAGSQNWTPGFDKEFLKRKGYDIHTYLPAMMGYVVDSRKKTEGFLYDLRGTISDMVSERYFGTLDSLCRNVGVNFTAQATGNGLSLAADNVKAKGQVQKPQGEFWAKHTHGSYDIKETSSAAHVYGKQIASAEAYTDAKFSQSLAEMKNLADFAYACQVNEFVICASAYQPWLDKYPGNTGGGRHYCLNRNNTVWEYSRPFWDYQARCAGMMRRGMPVVDLCIYLGETPPVKLLTYRLPEIPEGYDFDACTADALLNRMKAKEGEIVLPDGMSYHMLVLQKNNDITLNVLRHVVSLVKAGVPVYGSKPERSGSLLDLPYEEEYRQLTDELWGSEPASSGSRLVGKGCIYWGMPLVEALQSAGIHPDFGVKSNYTRTDRIYFSHRRLADAEVYFINNHSKKHFEDKVTLRTSYAYAEYWNPLDGTRYRLPVLSSDKEGLTVQIALASDESGFIVASNQANPKLPIWATPENEQATVVSGDWKVYFDPKWGGPGEVTFSQLTDWTHNADPRIRYYSGTAIYRKTIEMEEPKANEQVILHFDNLSFMGRVRLNGQEVSTVWCSPWEADLTPYIHSGANTLEIEVVNSLMNRMIGDASLPESQRLTYAYPEIAKPSDKLVPSGIIGQLSILHRTVKSDI